MLSIHLKYFIYRELKRAPQKLSFCFMWRDTGNGRILGNILKCDICFYRKAEVTQVEHV